MGAQQHLAEERRRLWLERRAWRKEAERTEGCKGNLDAHHNIRGGKLAGLTVAEHRGSFILGEPVTWSAHDCDIAPGEIGHVSGVKTDGRINVKFERGTFCFLADELHTYFADKPSADKKGSFVRRGGA